MKIREHRCRQRRLIEVVLMVCAATLANLPAKSCWAQPYDAAPKSLSIMSWNVEWMFDDYLGDNRSKLAREQSALSSQGWQAKLAAVAQVVAEHAPSIVALQEIEGEQTLAAIAQEIRQSHKIAYRTAFIQGTDSFTEQDVGLLVRNGLVAYSRREQSKAMFDSGMYYNLSKHLFAEFRWAQVEQPLTVLNVHLRATEQAAAFRQRQARLAPLAAATPDSRRGCRCSRRLQRGNPQWPVGQ